MKKILMISSILSSIAFTAQAQNYNPYYPSQAPAPQYNYYNNTSQSAYYQPRPQQSGNVYASNQSARRKNVDDFKKFSIGLDYVIGSTSMVSHKFKIANPLYGGEDYNGKSDDFEDKLDSLSGNIGWRPFRYLGFEAFYQSSLSDNQVKYQEHYVLTNRFSQAEYSVEYTAYGLDLIAYLPASRWLEFVASAGIANYDFKADVRLNAYDNSTANLAKSNPYKMDDSATAFRYGAGAQIWLSNRLAFRAFYRYADIGGDYFDDISEISLGVRYNF